jgi:quercetin dioxygenase-like cupin family protein
MTHNMRKLLTGLALIASFVPAMAEDALKIVPADSVVWKPHPLFPGAQTALLAGDPGKPETIVQRNKFPPNFKVAPHMHSVVEVGTIISGSLGHGEGDAFDPSKGTTLKAGSVFALPAGRPHYMWTASEEVVFQINFTGPATITFHNPADDTRRK